MRFSDSTFHPPEPSLLFRLSRPSVATTPLFRDRQGETEAPNLLSPAAVEVRLISSLVLTTSNQLLPCRYSLSLPARFRDRRWGRKGRPHLRSTASLDRYYTS